MRVLIITITLILGAATAQAQYVSSAGGGEWSDNNTWGGAAPPYTNVSNDVTINSYVTSNQSISFNTAGNTKDNFTVNDTLIIYGDLSLGLDDDFTLAAGAVLIIFGNFSAVNKVTIENGGYFVVLGDFTMTGGAQTSYDNTGDGQTYVTGTVDVSGVGGGGIPELDCDPDVDVGCGYGDAEDMYDDPIWDFIDEVDGGVSCSISVSGVVTDESSAGASDGSIDVTITGTTTPDIEWNTGETTEDLSGLTAGTYTIVVSEGPCLASLTFTVSVSCTPPTITGTTPGSRCGSGTVNLGATASAGTINWYDVVTGGTSLGTGTSFTTPSISTTTTYYVDATDAGCTTASRTAVTATVNSSPTANDQAPAGICSETSGENAQVTGINLTSLESSINGGAGITYTWYEDAGLTVSVGTPSNTTINVAITSGTSATKDFYCVVENTVSGCTNVATITYTIKRVPQTGAQYHVSNTW